MPYPQGAVVLDEDPFGSTPHRPFLVLSTEYLFLIGAADHPTGVFRSRNTNWPNTMGTDPDATTMADTITDLRAVVSLLENQASGSCTCS